MTLGADKAIKTGKWYSNELLRYEDLMFLSQSTYQNFTDFIALLAMQSHEDGSGSDRVLSGLELEHDTLLTFKVHAGAAISYAGTYYNGDTWGFVSSLGDVFSTYIDSDASLSVDSGDPTDPRIDTVEIRPVQADYNGIAREFKDPITGVISTVVTDTRREFGYQIQVSKGTPAASPSAPITTTGWIKIAEVTVAAGATSITQNDIKDVRDSDGWSTEASGTQYSEVQYHDVTVRGDYDLYGTLTVDTINEHTTDAGVTVEGILFKDSEITTGSGDLVLTSASNIVDVQVGTMNLGLDGTESGVLRLRSITVGASDPTISASSAGSLVITTNESGADITITASGTGHVTIESLRVLDSTISNPSGSLTVENVVFNGGGISSVTTLSMSSILSVDTISEFTGGSGVSIDGVTLQDNDVSATEVRFTDKTGSSGVGPSGSFIKFFYFASGTTENTIYDTLSSYLNDGDTISCLGKYGAGDVSLIRLLGTEIRMYSHDGTTRRVANDGSSTTVPNPMYLCVFVVV